MKKTVLITLNYLVEVDQEEIDGSFPKVYAVEEEITSLAEQRGKNMKWKWISSSQTVLMEDTLNCGHCEVCGCWVTNSEKPGAISGLQSGGTHDGKLLCDEHLPADHPWAFIAGR